MLDALMLRLIVRISCWRGGSMLRFIMLIITLIEAYKCGASLAASSENNMRAIEIRVACHICS